MLNIKLSFVNKFLIILCLESSEGRGSLASAKRHKNKRIKESHKNENKIKLNRKLLFQ